jgi:hypothetical protein
VGRAQRCCIVMSAPGGSTPRRATRRAPLAYIGAALAVRRKPRRATYDRTYISARGDQRPSPQRRATACTCEGARSSAVTTRIQSAVARPRVIRRHPSVTRVGDSIMRWCRMALAGRPLEEQWRSGGGAMEELWSFARAPLCVLTCLRGPLIMRQAWGKLVARAAGAQFVFSRPGWRWSGGRLAYDLARFGGSFLRGLPLGGAPVSDPHARHTPSHAGHRTTPTAVPNTARQSGKKARSSEGNREKCGKDATRQPCRRHPGNGRTAESIASEDRCFVAEARCCVKVGAQS